MADELSVRMRLRRVDIDREEAMRNGSAMYTAMERMGDQSVKYVQDELIRYDAIDSGTLYNSIDYRIRQVGDRLIADVGPYKDEKALVYAKYVHDGTANPGRPSIPQDGPKLMPVKIKGYGTVFVTRVRGQEPKPYIANALKKVKAGDFYE